jgi:hypothetical protein
LDYPGDGAETTLHLRVAIRAQQNALAYLGTNALNAASRAALRDSELLRTRIDVMKLECRQTPRIATEPTASASLTDEYLLDLSPPPYDRVLPAPSASEVTSRFTDVLTLAVMRAEQHDMGQPGFTRLPGPVSRASAGASADPQSVLCQPVAHRRLAATKRPGDRRDRRSRLHQCNQLVLGEASLRHVLRAIGRFEAVFLDPVADRRFVQVKSPAYLSEGEATAEKLLQRCAIHTPYCLRRLG